MPERILFVDDDPMLLSSIQRCLGMRYDIDTAESGEEGLRLIQEQGPYQVLITDMRMPRMDGIAFLQRARPFCDETTLIMLTGNQDERTRERANVLGNVDQLLLKPCDPEDLAQAIAWGITRQQEKALLVEV